ncbi:9959_t:CDS:2 [Acaulospora colombiana]|uniref:9959_t:CDS:1 n=1 Tax=Acaulospora colombiana TaxID=27376 RepID=A0ACA9QBM7_9GLOM|nr:9959_t:CDS:2 [Acaulospora colombiana]
MLPLWAGLASSSFLHACPSVPPFPQDSSSSCTIMPDFRRRAMNRPAHSSRRSIIAATSSTWTLYAQQECPAVLQNLRQIQMRAA